MTIKMCTARLQVRRDKSSVEAVSNCRLYLINRRTAKHKKKTSLVLLCSQNKSVTKRSIKLNKQNDKHISFVNVDHCWSS